MALFFGRIMNEEETIVAYWIRADVQGGIERGT